MGGGVCRAMLGHCWSTPLRFPFREARVLGDGCGLEPHEWPNSVNVNLYEHEGQNVGWRRKLVSPAALCENTDRVVHRGLEFKTHVCDPLVRL